MSYLINIFIFGFKDAKMQFLFIDKLSINESEKFIR